MDLFTDMFIERGEKARTIDDQQKQEGVVVELARDGIEVWDTRDGVTGERVRCILRVKIPDDMLGKDFTLEYKTTAQKSGSEPASFSRLLKASNHMPTRMGELVDIEDCKIWTAAQNKHNAESSRLQASLHKRMSNGKKKEIIDEEGYFEFWRSNIVFENKDGFVTFYFHPCCKHMVPGFGDFIKLALDLVFLSGDTRVEMENIEWHTDFYSCVELDTYLCQLPNFSERTSAITTSMLFSCLRDIDVALRHSPGYTQLEHDTSMYSNLPRQSDLHLQYDDGFWHDFWEKNKGKPGIKIQTNDKNDRLTENMFLPSNAEFLLPTSARWVPLQEFLASAAHKPCPYRVEWRQSGTLKTFGLVPNIFTMEHLHSGETTNVLYRESIFDKSAQQYKVVSCYPWGKGFTEDAGALRPHENVTNTDVNDIFNRWITTQRIGTFTGYKSFVDFLRHCESYQADVLLQNRAMVMVRYPHGPMFEKFESMRKAADKHSPLEQNNMYVHAITNAIIDKMKKPLLDVKKF